jgi:hypothetical protein
MATIELICTLSYLLHFTFKIMFALHPFLFTTTPLWIMVNLFYIRYLCLFAYSGVFVCFVCLRAESCVPNVARFFSGMSIILISPSVFSNVYCKCHYFNMSILTNNMCDLICIDLIRFLCLTPLSAIFQPYHGDQF